MPISKSFFVWERPNPQAGKLEELACRIFLGSIEADLETSFIKARKFFRVYPQIAPRFQQAKSDIFLRANAFWEILAKKASFFHQLKDNMSDLQEKIEDFAGVWVVTIGVLHIVPAIFLHIKTFIFSFPT